MDDLKKKTIIWGIIGLILYLVFFLYIDRLIDWWVHNNCSGTWVAALGNFISFFATGPLCFLALLFCFMLIAVYDQKQEKEWVEKLLFICVSVSIAIVIGEISKVILARYRPVMLFTENLYGLHFFSMKWELNSTPSGHTLRAFSFLTALCLLNRKKMPLYIFLAILVGLSRIAVTAHYPSDVIFGCFIGVFSALWAKKGFWGRARAAAK